MLVKCSTIENIIEAKPVTKDRKCCYINEGRDTIFFNCNKEKTERILVSVRRKMENTRLLYIDSNIVNQGFVPLGFIYDKIPKDSLLNKYFHIIVVSNKKLHTKSDYWFILDSADWRSGDTIFSYNQIAR